MGYYTDIQYFNQFYSPTHVQPKSNPAPTLPQPGTPIFVLKLWDEEHNMLNVGFIAAIQRYKRLFHLFVS